MSEKRLDARSILLLTCTALTLGFLASGCGGGSSSGKVGLATFCADVSKSENTGAYAQVAAALMSYPTSKTPSKAQLRAAAKERHTLAKEAPFAWITAAMETEATSFDKWAATGDDSANRAYTGSMASARVSSWLDHHC